ncbi:hypothetical protein QU755_20490 [Pseudomonas wenzhouensis]|nr:hypothetical protein [Pseudomonas wenzhouensis]MDM9653766.1 hypothetical protein [Pseudomonas wenzhouensis]
MSGKRVSSLILSLSKYAAVFLSLAICIVTALASSVHVPTFHMDGAFQTASGLFRLESGQLPGRDFYPYLGVGPLLAMFPIYKIFGGDLAATVAAAKFVTILLSWMAVATLWHFVLRPTNVIYSLIGSSLILFGVNFIASQSSLPNLLAFGVEPGNSLRPVRAVLPYLVALSIYFLIKSVVHVNARNFLISTTLGAALLWSNDYAIPTFGLFFLFVFFYLYCFERNWIRNASIIAATSIVVWFVLLSLVTAGHSFDLLKYNFFDVRKDQWWYFGPYGSNTRIFEIPQISRLFSIENYFPLFVLIVTLLVAIRSKLIENYLVFFIGLTLFSGGSLASIGGHLGGYFGGFYFWGVATSFVFCFKILVLVANNSKRLEFFRADYLPMLGLLMILLMVVTSLKNYEEKLDQLQIDPNKFYVDEFGAFLDVSFSEYINYARLNHENIVIEDYWGLWSSLYRKFPPWPVDSIIHALGNVREISHKALEKADIIITTRYSMSPAFQPWNLSQSYWFYDELISKWEPVFTSPTTMVWKRGNGRSAFVGVACKVSADKNSFTLPEAVPGFYRIALGYSSVGREGRHLLMARNNISYPFDTAGFVSLMPGKNIATFPVLLSPGGVDIFNLEVIGKAHAEISSCTADRILYENDELLHIRKPSDFFLTDANWINGIARRWAGFFTHNTEINRANFKEGNTVIFSNGDKRTIISAAENGPYLNIFVNGDILNPENLGFPSEYKVLQ